MRRERYAIWVKLDSIEVRTDRALKPSERIAKKMSKIRATTIQGMQAKLEVFHELGLLIISEDDTAGILRDLELMRA